MRRSVSVSRKEYRFVVFRTRPTVYHHKGDKPFIGSVAKFDHIHSNDHYHVGVDFVCRSLIFDNFR